MLAAVTEQNAPAVSVVVPAKDEAGSVSALAAEICAVLAVESAFEVIFVDDGSTDGTAAALRVACAENAAVSYLTHTQCFGQSAALVSGIRAARSDLIVTLDGDGQNDPADIPVLLKTFRTEQAGSDQPLMITGWRQQRADGGVRRGAAAIANRVRGSLLGDGTPDTGCGLKVFPRSLFLALPAFDHMHRFLPALAQRAGARTLSVPVRHRPRLSGRSKYGVLPRLAVGIVDLMGVIWLSRRALRPKLHDDGEAA